VSAEAELFEKTWDEKRLTRERVQRLQQLMRQENVGALLLKDWVNGRYVINTRIPSGNTFLPVEGRPIAFVRPMDAGYVEAVGVETRPYFYIGNPSDPDAQAKSRRWADGVAALLEEFGVGGEVLAIDEMDPASIIALVERGLKLRNARDLLQRASEVKTRDEILIYWETGKIYDRIMRMFRDQLRPGLTEREMIAFVYSKVVGMGAEGLLQINVCSGENTNPWFRWPTDRKFQDGDLVGIDLHVFGPGGYIYDASRTYLCGTQASDDAHELYERAREYNNACIEMLRPGVRIPELVANLPKVPEKYQERVYEFHILHSNGLTPGEYPNVEKFRRPVDDTIKENMILSLDCLFGEVGGREGVKLEELVLVTNTGAVKMADMPYEDRLLHA
jgi:Xaa-Pro aminopeptidase